MKYMTSEQIREKFISYFKGQSAKHENVASSALVPANDPSLLFTNAGMVQFKDVFLGIDKRAYSRAVTSQKCLRVGGKHNDLDQVGFTTRHHTFFEMLGNFSFGDYFKEDAISYAWNFLTEELGLPKDRLWVTVYKDDQESADIWVNKMNFPRERLVYCGDEDNFWSMGDVGPCGPCTEIFYDHGDAVAGGPPGTAEADGDRYVEIWNIVFMQYDRQQDQSLESLPRPSVDTGMGLERIAAVMQGVSDNYDIDLFKVLLAYVDDIDKSLVVNDKAKRVMVDHIRSSAFLITDGIYPSNEGRGYVLRRIIRRAVRFGYKSGLKIPFFYNLAQPLLEIMGEAYPELVNKKDIILSAIKREEEQFAETIKQGMRVLDKELQDMQGGVVSGDVAFTLYDTYGFPLDLTQDIAGEHGASVDEQAYELAMAKQRAQSKRNQGFSDMTSGGLAVTGETEFLGYDTLIAKAVVEKIFVAGVEVSKLDSDDNAILVLNRTPCYAESGGQVGDAGVITSSGCSFSIKDTQKQGKVFLHYGKLTDGSLVVGDEVDVEVDYSRQSIKLNHSATHLLHAALRHVLGEHVIQKGSLVDKGRLRFDFSHHNPVEQSQLQEIEAMVNNQILRGVEGCVRVLGQDEAKKTGAMALFDEKYDDMVRVVSFGEFSVELCGGTHVANTAEIGAFKITTETGIASGIRRIEAITGVGIVAALKEREQQLARVAKLVKATPINLENRIASLVAKNKELLSDQHNKKQSGLIDEIDEIFKKGVESSEYILLRHKFTGLDIKGLRLALDQIKAKSNGRAIVAVLASISTSEDKSFVLVYVADNVEGVSAKDVLAKINSIAGGSGGGRDSMAQGFITDTSKLNEALVSDGILF